ncbi:MAG: type VI secretion system tip protein VgrG [Verrucomicrobia bacterium]|nr:type VI secretion system tip protein VgrG [Verrucomicrobiota bacterium]
MPPKQESRLLGINTALGPEALAAQSVSVQEQLSRLFEIEAELVSEDGEIGFDKIVGHPATIRLEVGQNSKRYFNGFVSRLVQVPNQGGYARYRATLVPWLWLLTRTSDCRIFQEKSVPEIIEEVFKGHGFDDYQLKLSGSYEKKEYCVQYRETDFNFVSRLMEQEGIYYFFTHEDGKHMLVLADSISAHKPFEGYEEVAYYELERGAGGREAVTDWTVVQEVQPGAYALNDFDFKKPKASLRASTSVTRQHGQAKFEIYDYPGEYLEQGEGERLADVRLHELQAQHELLRGQASARGLAAGNTFKLKNHPRSDQNREYLITGVSLRVDAGEFASGGAEGEGEFFSCSFTAIDSQQVFRAARKTPKPIVQGPQTAIVSGPSGEEIYTDEHARVKVQFHWDRYGKADENSSCWVRVSQYWAGKEWGAIHIPRMGQEVIIEFLEGDPDRPIITGRVYNADQVPPYELPANKTQSGIKSRSSKGASTPNFNEIRFEDKKGEEQLFIHAEKDQDIEVENDETHWVGHDRVKTIDNDETTHVKHDRSETVDNDESITIHGNRAETVNKNETITIDENRTTSIGKNEDLSVGAKRSVSVEADETIDVGGKRTQTVAKDETLSVGGNLQQTIEKSQAIKVGKSFVLEAADDITLKTGSASITMKKDGTIQIKGKDLTLEGSGKINAKASGDMILKGSKIAAN